VSPSGKNLSATECDLADSTSGIFKKSMKIRHL
jgi:hypothetical protein